ncbi:MAG: fatty acyl-AMP ligase [Geminicoccaceae bacterium]|nr:fatty acyl-AMP ligase [Geminicoccaceae bacterium]MDW8125103.1 fatty acyl-AMP ligase [Geminicoccaceae bacterium]
MVQPTPTVNTGLPLRTRGFRTLVEGLEYAALGETGANFYGPRGELERVLPYRELRTRALDFARRLAGLGLPRCERVAVLAETTPEFLALFFACQYAGLVPVPLPLALSIGTHRAHVERLRGMLESSAARVAIGSEAYLAQLEEAAVGTEVGWVGTYDGLAARPPVAGGLAPLGPDEPCYIQYSSGSTSFPRGVLVTQAAITANARAIAEDGLALQPGDRCTSWLPLYHDMGLVGCCLTPVLNQVSVDYIATASFACRPLVWLKVLSASGGTISFAPTFGYELCARRVASRDLSGLDLARWRVAGIGGEMIRPRALAEFAEAFAPAGFDARAFVPSYGLAEATLAVTFAPLGRGVRTDLVELGEAFERRRLALPAGPRAQRTRAFAICGRPMPGYEIEIRDEHGRRLPERRIGRVCIRGPSLMTGYFRSPQATRDVLLEDGWLDTGDMGYLVDGELVVTGRSKDLIIINGRNIWPQDLEWAVERLPGVRPGDVAAFAVTGEDERERIVVVVQCRISDPARQAEFRREVQAVINRQAGTECELVLAPPRSLTYTTSGKLSRAAARANYLSGVIRDVAGNAPSGAQRAAKEAAVAFARVG